MLWIVKGYRFLEWLQLQPSLKGYSIVIKLYFMVRHSHQNGYVSWCVCRCVSLKSMCIAGNLHHTAVVHEGFRSNQHFLTVVSLSIKRGDKERGKRVRGYRKSPLWDIQPLHPHLHTLFRVHTGISSIYTYTPGANITMTFREETCKNEPMTLSLACQSDLCTAWHSCLVACTPQVTVYSNITVKLNPLNLAGHSDGSAHACLR